MLGKLLEMFRKFSKQKKSSKGLCPPAAGPQKNEGMMLRGYEATRLSLW